MSDQQPTAAHPEALREWRDLVGEPDPQALVWALRALGVPDDERRAS